jgi:sulfate permease, SulP family
MLKLEVHGTNLVKQLLQVVRELPLANIPTLCLSAGVVALVLLSYRFMPRFPGALLAVVGTVAASQHFISRDTESRWSVPSQSDRLIFLSRR